VVSVPSENTFASTQCCSATGAGFALQDVVGNAFTTDALPTVLKFSDFDSAASFLEFGAPPAPAQGNITSINVVTLDSAKDDSFSCGPGTIWYWVFSGKTIPDFPGPATLTGTVTYGSSKATTSTTVVIQ
jgi:hypothetical protein